MASDDGLQQLAVLLNKLDQRANDVGEAIRLLQDVIPDLERRLDDLAVRMQPFLEASKPLDDVQTRLQKAADAIRTRAKTLDDWMESTTVRLDAALQERNRLLEQRAESLFRATNQRADELVRSVQEACTTIQEQTLADVEARAQQLEEWMDSTSQRLREAVASRQSDLEEQAKLVFERVKNRVSDFVISVEVACASLKDQASKFDELERAATEDVRRIVESASRRDDEIALRLGNLASDLERALEEFRRRSEQSLQQVGALSVRVGHQTDALSSSVAFAAEAAADRLRREAETTAHRLAEDIRHRVIVEIGQLRDEALADLEGRTSETMGRLREDLLQFEERWRRSFTELLVQLQGTTTVVLANEEELNWLERMVRQFLRWISKLK